VFVASGDFSRLLVVSRYSGANLCPVPNPGSLAPNGFLGPSPCNKPVALGGCWAVLTLWRTGLGPCDYD
jgi:hypothetical protein